MSLDKDLETLAKVAVDAFNKKTGTSFTIEDLDYRIRRPDGKGIARFLLTTKVAGDNARFQLNIMEFSSFTSLKPFTMKVRKSTASGDLSNEVFISDATLSKMDYGYLLRYLGSGEFRAYVNEVPVFASASGAPIMLKSGRPLFTHQ